MIKVIQTANCALQKYGGITASSNNTQYINPKHCKQILMIGQQPTLYQINHDHVHSTWSEKKNGVTSINIGF